MRRYIPMLLSPLACFLLATPALLTAIASSVPSAGPSDSPIGLVRHEQQMSAIEQQMAARATSHKQHEKDPRSWALAPRYFDALSSSARRGLLIATGQITLPETSKRAGAQKAAPQAGPPLPGENIRVDNPNLDAFRHTHSETSIAVHGAEIVETYNDSDVVQSSGYAYSTDGGATFTPSKMPLGSDTENLGDGVVVAGPNGEFYHSQIAFGISADSTSKVEFGNYLVAVSKSTDGGATFSNPVDASTTADNRTDIQDKPWIAVDGGAASPYRGNVYVSWTDFRVSGGVVIDVARSTDGGASFQPPVTVTDPNLADPQGSIPAVGPDGKLYVAYLGYAADSGPAIMIAKSTDGGATFSQPIPAAPVNPVTLVTGGEGVRANSFPNMAVDPSGVVHIVFDSQPAVGGPDPSDAFYVRSTDGGATFSSPLRLNDDSTTTTQLFPTIAAATSGAIGVKWWDRRNDPVNDNLNDVYMTISTDGGRTFAKNFRITDHNWIFGPVDQFNAGDYHGDYDGITADAGNFYLSWSDERNFSPDAFFAFVPENHDPATPDFNISAQQVYQTVVAGSSTQLQLSTRGDNGFSDKIALSVSPPVPGITFSFDSGIVAPGTLATLAIAADPSATTGTYDFVVQASSGTLVRSSNFELTIYGGSRPGGALVNISQSRGFSSTQGGLQTDRSGNVHLVYDDDSATGASGGQVFYRRSTDGGLSYSAPTLVSTNPGTSSSSTLSIDQKGDLCVLYLTSSKTAASGFFISFSTDGGNSFSTPTLVDLGVSVLSIAMAVDPAGRIEIVYVSVENNALMVTASADGGQSFSAPQQVSGPREQPIVAQGGLAFDQNGAAYLAYSDSTTSGATVKFAAAADGVHFSAPVPLASQLVPFVPEITTAGGTVYVAYGFIKLTFGPGFISTEPAIAVVRSCNGGKSFSQPSILPTNLLGLHFLDSIVADSSGHVDVAFDERRSSETREEDTFLSRSMDGGATFEQPANMSGGSGISFGAVLAQLPDGNLVMGWNDTSFAASEVISTIIPPPPSEAPDFSLVPEPLDLNVSQGHSGSFSVFIGRPGGFSGSVTVTASDTSAFGVTLRPASSSSQCLSTSFQYSVAKKAPVGAFQIVFTGRNQAGTERSATMPFVIRAKPKGASGG